MKVIHLSDLHIGKKNNLKNVVRLVDWILQNKDQHQSKVVVISGDLVEDGKKSQFIKARNQIKRLRGGNYTVLVAPGNHDYGLGGFQENPKSKKHFHELISDIKEYPHLHFEDGQAFVILDSMEEEMAAIDLWGAQGTLGRKQLQKLDKILDDLADNPAVENVVVIQHHHPFDYLFYHGLRDHADLKGVVSRRLDSPPRVNALLFGHKHLDHRFNDPDENKEELYGIDMIYASGSTVEVNKENMMILPVIDLDQMIIKRFKIKGS